MSDVEISRKEQTDSNNQENEKIKNSSELEFAVFCIENVAAKLGVDAERVYQALTERSDILNGYIPRAGNISLMTSLM